MLSAPGGKTGQSQLDGDRCPHSSATHLEDDALQADRKRVRDPDERGEVKPRQRAYAEMINQLYPAEHPTL